MKIYGSTEYVDVQDRDEPWYELEVINQWDWLSKAVCCRAIYNDTVFYALHKCTRISDSQSSIEKITELTDEMKTELIRLGYTIK